MKIYMKKQLLILTTALLNLNGFAQVPSYVPTNGLVGYWPFNGNTIDESGNGNVGISTNVQFSSDRLGNPLSSALFDGVMSNIAFPASSSFQPTSYTISAWFKTSVIQSGSLFNPLGQTIVCYSPINWNQGPAYKAWLWTTDNSILSSRQWTPATSWEDINTNPNTINANEWRHCVLVFDEFTNSQKLYIDGVLYGTLNSVLEYNSQVNFIIGASKENSAGTICNVFNGNLDDIGFWNRALTVCEIQNLYASQLNSTFVSAGIDESICNGEQVTLTASGSQNYSWNNGVVDGAPFSPTNTLDYIVTADSAGCQSADTLTVFVNQPTNSTLNETALDSLSLNGQTYNQSGTYTQVIPNAAGCDSTITLNLSLDFTGLLELDNSFTISPNPAKDQLNVLSPSGTSENYFLLDGQGRKVLTGKLTGTTTSIDISKLAAGNYLVQVGEEQMPVRIVKN